MTTTCDLLWLGVPVISLAGPTHVSRIGLSLLSAVGLPDLVAATPDQYVRIAADLASDLPRLHDLRATLRQRMERSPLRDERGLTQRLESAYHDIWLRHCTADSRASITPSPDRVEILSNPVLPH